MEVLFVSALSVVALGILWQIYHSAIRQAARLETRLAGLAGTQLLMDRLRHDVSGGLYAPGDDRPVVESPNGEGSRLNLLLWSGYRLLERPEALYDPAENTPTWVQADRVRYDFDPASGYLTRTSPAGVERLTFGRYRSLRFQHSGDGAEPESLAVTLALGETPEARIKLVLPLPYRSESRSTHLWPDEYFHVQPRVRERGEKKP